MADKHTKTIYCWAVKWVRDNKLDGRRVNFIGISGEGMFFKTRQAARDYIKEHYGYIRNRPDLQAEPHGWKMPVPVKISVTIQEL